jgi:hypothetical protein
MKNTIYLIALYASLYGHPFTCTASAEILFQSGTLGPTGITWNDLALGNVPGTNVNSAVYAGVRFQLTQAVKTTSVGGHFVAPANGTFFGAIVSLDDANDFPDSGDLSTPDVLGATTIEFPSPSNEVFGNLPLQLDPGWYALVFGSGLFGSTGAGGALRNGMDIGSPTYIAFQPLSGAPWLEISPDFSHHRFVVTGTIVPEPGTFHLITLAVLSLFLCGRALRA